MDIILPTVYFGNIHYFKTLFSYQSVLIEAKEHFVKQTFRNRCEILTSNGVQQLSIPVVRSNGSKTTIDEVTISFDTDWRKDHWKAIESAYSSSPYFEHYGQEVKELIYQEETNLLKFNQLIQCRISNWLGLDHSFRFTSSFSPNSNLDFNYLNQNVKGDVIKYIQVFEDRTSFCENASILDAIFCLGPMARNLL